jgi:hypothetical protein
MSRGKTEDGKTSAALLIGENFREREGCIHMCI